MSCIPAIFHEVQFTNDEFQTKGTKMFILIDLLRMNKKKMNEKKKRRKRINSQVRNELGQSREKVANERDYIAPPSSDNTLSLLHTAIFYRTLYPSRGYKR